MTLSPTSRTALLDVARAALIRRLNSGKSDSEFPAPPTFEELLRPAGCFVTLHERPTHRLRGCVGRLDAQKPLWETVLATASDVLRDPRFVTDPVTAAEIDRLEVEISVLSPPRQAASPLDFDLLTDGIYLTADGHAGFFLPQVAQETGWSREQLLSRLCSEKLRLDPQRWRFAGATLYTFKVEVIGPEPLSVPD